MTTQQWEKYFKNILNEHRAEFSKEVSKTEINIILLLLKVITTEIEELIKSPKNG